MYGYRKYKPCYLLCYYVYVIESGLVTTEESHLIADFPKTVSSNTAKISK